MEIHSGLTHDLPQEVHRAYTPLFGYYVADELLEVEIVCNGQRRPVSQSDRQDMFKSHPNRLCRGFYAVYVADETADSLHLQVIVGARIVCDATVPIAAAARAEARQSRKSRSRKRAFAQSRMICVQCGAPRPAPTPSCKACGTQFDLSTDAISAVPLGTYDIPKTINTSLFPYGSKEQALIDEVQARKGWVLDFGSGLHPSSIDNVIRVEIADMPSTDVVSIASRLPFQDDSFDAVLTQHVLEHVEQPWNIARELVRVAKPGALILSTVPYVCPVHGFPNHYFNPTPSGLRSLFAGTEMVSHTLQDDAHPINGIKQLLQVLHGSLPVGDRDVFGAMTIDQVISHDLEALRTSSWGAALPQSAWWDMPAHSTIVVRKPGDAEDAPAG